MSRITESARGEICQVRIPGVCTYGPETVIWSHARWGLLGAVDQSRPLMRLALIAALPAMRFMTASKSGQMG